MTHCSIRLKMANNFMLLNIWWKLSTIISKGWTMPHLEWLLKIIYIWGYWSQDYIHMNTAKNALLIYHVKPIPVFTVTISYYVLSWHTIMLYQHHLNRTQDNKLIKHNSLLHNASGGCRKVWRGSVHEHVWTSPLVWPHHPSHSLHHDMFKMTQ